MQVDVMHSSLCTKFYVYILQRFSFIAVLSMSRLKLTLETLVTVYSLHDMT